jgi:uncharacterized protein (DUF983 family)
MNKEELKKKQEELDEEITLCPECGKSEKWGFIKEWGNCIECEAYYKEKPKQHLNE